MSAAAEKEAFEEERPTSVSGEHLISVSELLVAKEVYDAKMAGQLLASFGTIGFDQYASALDVAPSSFRSTPPGERWLEALVEATRPGPDHSSSEEK